MNNEPKAEPPEPHMDFEERNLKMIREQYNGDFQAWLNDQRKAQKAKAEGDGLEDAAKAFIRQRNLKRYGVESEHAHWTIAEVAEYTRQRERETVAKLVRRLGEYGLFFVSTEIIERVAKEMNDE